MLGKYPEDGLRAMETDLPRIGGRDMALIHQPLDFYGQNIYRGVPTRAGARRQARARTVSSGRPQNGHRLACEL